MQQQQQTLEQSIVAFENWQADIGAKRMRIAALLRYGMAKKAGEQATGHDSQHSQPKRLPSNALVPVSQAL